MANVDRPNGFRFAKSLTGQAPNAMIRTYTAADVLGRCNMVFGTRDRKTV